MASWQNVVSLISQRILLSKTYLLRRMVKASLMVLVLLNIMAISQVVCTSNGIPNIVMAQPITQSSGGNQTGISDVVPYNNPNLGFSLEYPANWEKEESLTFVSPQGGVGNRTPEVISITTEVLPTSDFNLERYTAAALGQVEVFQDFRLLNSSSTTLGGFPSHLIVYTFTDESQTPLQNLQVWTVKDGMAYVITYGGTPEEFDSSLPAFQSIIDSFSLE
jgi:hypothetical protein